MALLGIAFTVFIIGAVTMLVLWGIWQLLRYFDGGEKPKKQATENVAPVPQREADKPIN